MEVAANQSPRSIFKQSKILIFEIFIMRTYQCAKYKFTMYMLKTLLVWLYFSFYIFRDQL